VSQSYVASYMNEDDIKILTLSHDELIHSLAQDACLSRHDITSDGAAMDCKSLIGSYSFYRFHRHTSKPKATSVQLKLPNR